MLALWTFEGVQHTAFQDPAERLREKLSLVTKAKTVYSSATMQKGWLMPKVLCLIGLVLASLVFLIFLSDLVLGVSGMESMAPFRMASWLMDVLFMVSSGGLAYAAWSTFREQK